MEISRDFKGIWIDRDIWLDRSLTYFEKCLFAEIHSLDGKDGCFASNEYLCEFFNEKERKIQDGLAKLKAKGYIFQESFDGRTRVLRTNKNPKNKEITPENDKSLFSTPEVQDPELYKHNLAPLRCEISHPSHKDPYYIERKDLDKRSSSPTSSSNPNPADLIDVDYFFFSEKERDELQKYTDSQIADAKAKTNATCVQKKNGPRVKFFFKVLASLAESAKKTSSSPIAKKIEAQKTISEKNRSTVEAFLAEWEKPKLNRLYRVDFEYAHGEKIKIEVDSMYEDPYDKKMRRDYGMKILEYSDLGFYPQLEKFLREKGFRKK